MTPQTHDLLARLVAFPTVTSATNLDCVDFIAGYLHGHGVEPTVLPQPDGRNANLWATIGPREDGGVMLSGHLDVVPVEGQPWSADPFVLTRRGSRLYGRGACDMKGFDACVLAAVPAMTRAKLKRPIHIAFTADEEVRMSGGAWMARRLGVEAPKPAICIVGEPSSMKVVTGHKGYTLVDVHVRGHEVHSSNRYQGVSAVMVAARLIAWVEDYDLALKARAERDGGAPLFDPSWTVLHAGTISGGTAHNITARDCRFIIGVRTVPGASGMDIVKDFDRHVRETVEPAMKAISSEAGITWTIGFDVPAMKREDDGAAEALARRLTGDNGLRAVSYGAEGGLYQHAGVSTVICGPGDIAQAHQPDEWIEESELSRCEGFLSRLVADCAT